MTPKHSDFTDAATEEAKRALEVLTPKEQVYFALNVILNVIDTRAHVAVGCASLEIKNHCEQLTLRRVAEERE